ncbi:MAG: LicD family protein [Tannerellaceae bacterium]|jgi:lipopolysaccharide cholinephosphotransferase|nr:LicD family protein [Tannerellaceae bacterium]
MDNTAYFDSKFPDKRAEGETVLRQAQLVMLRMLKIIDYLCRKHGIRYWLCSGTLLGAVRHKGFIPWDDDLDISMPREDYERFVKIALAEFPADMMIQTLETDPHYKYLPLPCKVRDKKSYTLSPGFDDEESAKGLFVDIFPVDRFHLSPFTFRYERWLKVYNTFICKCLISVHFAHESKVRRFLSYFHPLFHFMVARYMRFAKRIIESNKKLGSDCYIGAGFDTMWIRYYKYDDIYPLTEVSFEDALFLAPRSTDAYLKAIYGPDYMTPLPESKRIVHASVIKPIL